MSNPQDSRAPTFDELDDILREVRAIVAEGEKRRGDAGVEAKRRSRMEVLRELSKEAVQAHLEKLLRPYVQGIVGEEGSGESSADVVGATEIPATPEAHARIAGAAAGEIQAAAAALHERSEELRQLFAASTSSTDTDTVRVAKINAAVERERNAALHVEAYRKLESDQKNAALALAVKQLEGEQQKTLAEMKNATDRAVAAEKSASALAVQKKKGWSALVVAIVGLASAVGGGVVGAIAKTATGSPSARPSVSGSGPETETASIDASAPASLTGDQGAMFGLWHVLSFEHGSGSNPKLCRFDASLAVKEHSGTHLAGIMHADISGCTPGHARDWIFDGYSREPYLSISYESADKRKNGTGVFFFARLDKKPWGRVFRGYTVGVECLEDKQIVSRCPSLLYDPALPPDDATLQSVGDVPCEVSDFKGSCPSKGELGVNLAEPIATDGSQHAGPRQAARTAVQGLRALQRSTFKNPAESCRDKLKIKVAFTGSANASEAERQCSEAASAGSPKLVDGVWTWSAKLGEIPLTCTCDSSE